MSLTSAMFTGVSGLLNQAEGINVIGNNIANVNTVGFKGSRTLFSDVLSTSVSGGSQMGHGVKLQKIDNMFSQATFENTGSVTDLAIQGDRFFALAAPSTTGATAIEPSAAYYTRAGSFRLDGQATATIAGTLVNPEGYVVLDANAQPIQITNQIAAVAGPPAVAAKDFQKISSIDSKGVMTLLYADATGASATYYYAGNGIAPVSTSVAANYAAAVKLGTVQVGNPPGMDKVGGTLYKVTAQSGIPAVATAATPWASNGVTESISSNNLEQSNVDMANEFVKMILTQRAYSANSKTITTTDEMTQEVLSLKR